MLLFYICLNRIKIEMKKTLLVLLLFCTIQLFGQDYKSVLTDHKVALQQAKTEDKPMLVVVTNNKVSEDSKRWQNELFASELLKQMSSKIIVLKLDVSDEQSVSYRMGTHYIKNKSGFGFALVDSDNNTIGNPLIDLNSKSIEDFLVFIKSKL